MRTKYNATKTEIDGHKFDSKAEAEYYVHLLELVRNGQIRDLQLQPKFGFIIHGEPLKSHKNRAITYSADFKWWENVGSGSATHWKTVVADVKGMETDVWRIKWALVKALHPGTEFRIIKKVKGEWVKS